MAPRKRRAADDDEATVKNPSTEPATRRVTRSLTAGTKGNEPSKVTVKPPAEQRPKKRTKVTASAKEKKPEEAAENEKGSENVGGSLKTIVIEHCKQCNSFKTRAIQVKDGLEAGVSGITVLVNPDKPRRGCFEIREEGVGWAVNLGFLDHRNTDLSRKLKFWTALGKEFLAYLRKTKVLASDIPVEFFKLIQRRGSIGLRNWTLVTSLGSCRLKDSEMKRPFTPMKALDMDKVIADIMEKIK